MQITMKTPFGEMNFDMPQEKVSDLMQRAFQYAAGQEPPKTSPTAPPVAQEPSKAPDTAIKPQSRVERMFGNFKAAQGAAQSTAPTAAQSEPPKGPESYKGFLLVKCEECGKIRGFCAKTPATSSRCECGHRTELHGMRIAHLECKCGSRFTYHTNITEEVFDYPCLHCGSPVDLRLNKRGDTYVTIKD